MCEVFGCYATFVNDDGRCADHVITSYLPASEASWPRKARYLLPPTSYLLPSTFYLLPELRFYKDFTSPRWQILPAPRRITIGEQHETDASRPPVARQEQNATLPRLRVQDAFRQHSCAFSRYHSPCWQPEKVAFFRWATRSLPRRLSTRRQIPALRRGRGLGRRRCRFGFLPGRRGLCRGR